MSHQSDGTTLVTGATGTVGHAIVRRLTESGRMARALVRSAERARRLLPGDVEVAEGDVADASSVRRAVEGCKTVYHASGLPEQWRKDTGDFQRVNVQGTANMIDAALAAGIESFVYTSTIDILDRRPGVEFDESTVTTEPLGTEYERSKQEADRLVVEAIAGGLPARILHPSAVYGPAPVVNPGLNDFLVRVARRKVPMLLPGGLPLVLSEDCAEGHVAAEQAPVGARYILSESYRTLSEVAAAVAEQVPRARVPRVAPLAVARLVSEAGERIAGVTRRPPLIPRGQLHFLESNVRPSAAAARRDLGWKPAPFDEGVRLTIDHFRRFGAI